MLTMSVLYTSGDAIDPRRSTFVAKPYQRKANYVFQ
jgi:hypothetical protein